VCTDVPDARGSHTHTRVHVYVGKFIITGKYTCLFSCSETPTCMHICWRRQAGTHACTAVRAPKETLSDLKTYQAPFTVLIPEAIAKATLPLSLLHLQNNLRVIGTCIISLDVTMLLLLSTHCRSRCQWLVSRKNILVHVYSLKGVGLGQGQRLSDS
jgi:hypothetical protein